MVLSRSLGTTVATMVLFVSVTSAARNPVLVSPASASGGPVEVEAACPTFNWSGVNNAASVEVVVYAMDGKVSVSGVGELKVATRIELPGDAQGWTPTMDQCLERGQRYVWSLRARYKKKWSAWSEPQVFTVSAASCGDGLALTDLLDLYEKEGRLSEQDRGLLLGTSGSEGASGAGETGAAESPQVSEQDAASSSPALGGADFSIDVGGNVIGNSFAGNGAGLTNVDADLLDGKDSTAFGDIFGVLPGSGLTGGATSGTATLAVATSGITETHLATNSVGASEIAANAVGESEIAENSVGVTEIATNAVRGRELTDSIRGIAVECFGECNDSTLGQVCDTAWAGAEPLGVACVDILEYSSGYGCGGDNRCSGAGDIRRATQLHRFCEDVSGYDAIVYCIYP